jgi:hypothetical protein
MTQPVVFDNNTMVGKYPWDSESGATHSYDTISMAVMTDNAPLMQSPYEFVDEYHAESTTPEGADEGQTGDQGGDADGQNFGQDQGEEDTMTAQAMDIPGNVVEATSKIPVVGPAIAAIIGGTWWFMSRRKDREQFAAMYNAMEAHGTQ